MSPTEVCSYQPFPNRPLTHRPHGDHRTAAQRHALGHLHMGDPQLHPGRVPLAVGRADARAVHVHLLDHGALGRERDENEDPVHATPPVQGFTPPTNTDFTG